MDIWKGICNSSITGTKNISMWAGNFHQLSLQRSLTKIQLCIPNKLCYDLKMVRNTREPASYTNIKSFFLITDFVPHHLGRHKK